MRCSVTKGILRNFAKFTGKQLCQSLFFNKVADLRLWHGSFPVNFAKFLKMPFLQNTSRQMLQSFSFCFPVFAINVHSCTSRMTVVKRFVKMPRDQCCKYSRHIVYSLVTLQSFTQRTQSLKQFIFHFQKLDTFLQKPCLTHFVERKSSRKT